MKKYFSAIGLMVCTAISLASDDLGDKIKAGFTRDAVIALIGSPPDEEGCKTYLGVSACRLTWNKGGFQRARYEVEFIAGRVVTVQVTKTKNILWP